MPTPTKSASHPGGGSSSATQQKTSADAPYTGEFEMVLQRTQWLQIVRALSIASGRAGEDGNYEQMFAYNTICDVVGAKLGLNAQTTTTGARARAASA